MKAREAELYRQIRKWEGLAFARVGYDFEDVLHDTFVVTLLAWRAGRIQHQGVSWGYAFTVFQRMCMRRAARLAARVELDPLMVDPAPGVEQRMLAADRERLARACVAAVRSETRRLVLQCRLAGMSDEETRRELGISASQYRNGLHRGMVEARERWRSLQ